MMKLAEPSFLRPFHAEHRPYVVKFGEWAGFVEVVFQVTARDRSGPLRPHGVKVLLVMNEEHLFLHYFRTVA
jgi:hypothetical protein